MWFVVYHYGYDRDGKKVKWLVAIFRRYPSCNEYINTFNSEFIRRTGRKLDYEIIENLTSVFDEFEI